MRVLKELFVLMLFSCLLIACKENDKKADRGELIVIDDFDTKELVLSDFVEKVQTFKLETDSFIIGEIKDLCVYDSIMFLIDELTMNLIAYDLNNESICVLMLFSISSNESAFFSK